MKYLINCDGRETAREKRTPPRPGRSIRSFVDAPWPSMEGILLLCSTYGLNGGYSVRPRGARLCARRNGRQKPYVCVSRKLDVVKPNVRVRG